jgi:YHS domain-containing protein
MHILKTFFAAFALLLSLGGLAHADQITNFTKDGVAIAGADPVAYFTMNKSVIGSADFTTEWNGVTWRFSSAENRDAFKAEPAKYAPQYGGYCAIGTSFGKKIPVDPTQFKIEGGKLYLNSSAGSQGMFLKDTMGAIKKADTNWTKIEAVPADKL